MATYDGLAGLELEISGMRTERREVRVSTDFLRVTTTVVLEGGGSEGRGEDVTYDGVDHDDVPLPALTGSWSLDALSQLLGTVDLFPTKAPEREVSREYRRWAFESAALDLALRQQGVSLGERIGRPYRPVRFVVSTRGDVLAWHAADPALEFKLDPERGWDRAFMERLAATGRVRVLDFKAYYRGTVVDLEPDAGLYRTALEVFPDAVIEDAALDGPAGEVARTADGRLSFDAPIHSLADVDALPVRPRVLNVKPSRFGSLARLLECIDACEARGVAMYGGGQFELGVGRGQVQVLASLFYADGPNDVAPSVYNESEPQPGLPASPLAPPAGPAGFSWEPKT
jgi:hypothetical protein